MRTAKDFLCELEMKASDEDRLICLYGLMGVGKTTLLRRVKTVCVGSGASLANTAKPVEKEGPRSSESNLIEVGDGPKEVEVEGDGEY
jgi:ABC-type cobalamin/Fe3+-siderophores transport system ATPase subunit